MNEVSKIMVSEHSVLEVLSTPPTIPYGVRMIGAPEEWRETQGQGVRVAVLDTGRPNHPDLRVVESVDFTNTHVDDRNGHATHVCGSIAADGRIKGVAPKCDLFALKVLRDFDGGTFEMIINGIRWCIANKMDVVNLSLSAGLQVSEAMHQAIRDAHAAGIVIVAAAGNAGTPIPPQTSRIGIPASYPECIATVAVDIERRRPEFSSVGAEADLAAAGVEIHSTHLNGQYARLSGTSMACPHIAGAAALMIAKARIRSKPVSSDMIRYAMQIYADDLGTPGRDDLHGFGVFSFDRFQQTRLQFRTGQTQYFKNGIAQTAHIAPRLIENRTMVGLRDVGEAFDCEVNWTPPDNIEIIKR